MKRDSLIAEIMNYIVSGYVYFVALTLVFYMVTSLVTGFLSVGTGLLDIYTSIKTILSAPERSALEVQLLHTIAFTIVLVKAYKILISYAQKRHVSIKYLVEISIIAPTIEIVFNSQKYPIEVSALFAVYAFANLIAYLHFYPTIKHVSNDYDRDFCEPEKIETSKPVKIAKVVAKVPPKKKAS
jgi:uncharacterized membrane protein (DUF373 family)